MKIIKKILRIIAIILPCFCFTLISSDTYALKYTLDSIPYWQPTVVYGSSEARSTSLSRPLSVTWSSYQEDPFFEDRFSNITAPWAFNSYKSGDKCVYGVPSGVNRPDYYNWSWYGDYSSTLRIGGWPQFLNSDSRVPESECMLLTNGAFRGFGNNNVPDFQASSIPLIGNPFTYNFRSFLPYNFDYDSFGIAYNMGDGTSDKHIQDLDLFSHSIDRFQEIQIPMNFDISKIGGLTAGRPLRLSGRFTFFGQNNSVLNSNNEATLTVEYLYHDDEYNRDIPNWQAGSSDHINYCSVTQRVGTDSSAPIVYFDCDFTPEYDVISNYIGFTFTLRSTSGPEVINAGCPSDNEHSCWGLSFAYVTTDNDFTPSDDDISFVPTGHSQNNAPGFPGYYESGEDYLSRITNLFNFSFINPFTPLFGLFTDSSRCVQIPTIAGMLGAESSTYCPWFDSTVRNILTPVLGISANMLLFGFLVKWLGARSGNFVEDTTNKGGK